MRFDLVIAERDVADGDLWFGMFQRGDGVIGGNGFVRLVVVDRARSFMKVVLLLSLGVLEIFLAIDFYYVHKHNTKLSIALALCDFDIRLIRTNDCNGEWKIFIKNYFHK